MKKLFNRSIAMLLAALMIFGAAPSIFNFSSKASAASVSGTCGEDLDWSLNAETKELNITGTGDMEDYTAEASAPWYTLRNSIKSVKIDTGVASIGDFAFKDCSLLSNVYFNSGSLLTDIGNSAFYACTFLNAVNIPYGVTSIGDHAFYCCGALMQLTIPSSVAAIGDSAFAGCDTMMSVVIPSSVVTLGNHSFTRCKTLRRVEFGNNSRLTSIGDFAFSDCCMLDEIEIPFGVKTIGESAFSNCDWLKHIEIPNSVTGIGAMAFAYCEVLEYVHIPSSVTSIGEDILKGSNSDCFICSNSENSSIADYAEANDIAFWVCDGRHSPLPKQSFFDMLLEAILKFIMGLFLPIVW